MADRPSAGTVEELASESDEVYVFTPAGYDEVEDPYGDEPLVAFSAPPALEVGITIEYTKGPGAVVSGDTWVTTVATEYMKSFAAAG